MSADDVLRQIETRGIHTIKVEFPDLFGIARVKAVPVGHFPHVLEHGIQFGIPAFALDLAGNLAEGTGVAEEVGYADMTAIPNPGTFCVLPWEPGTAAVIADLYYQGELVEMAPRRILQRIVTAYAEQGYTPIVGSELEFYLLRQVDGRWETYVTCPGMLYTWNETVDELRISQQIGQAMEAMGHPVTAYAHEFFPGQYEINLLHGPALEVADRTFFFKQAVKEIAHKNGLLATFMAKPRNDLGGSGYHLHMSLSDERGRNLFYDPDDANGLSTLARNFIAGQLAHARSAIALFAPTVNSYKRYVLGAFAPYYVLWGLDNRTCYVRVPPERGGDTRVENRAPDGAANPYLAIAVALAAGLDGIDRRLNPGPPYEGDAYTTASPAEHEVVPLYFHEAIDELLRDEHLCQMLGPEFVRAYTAVKRLEIRRFREYVTEWEFNEYAYHL